MEIGLNISDNLDNFKEKVEKVDQLLTELKAAINEIGVLKIEVTSSQS